MTTTEDIVAGGATIAFTKAGADPDATRRRHRATVARADGTVTVVAVADYGDALPHDLVHVVVERELGLAFGFWGLVVAGAALDDHGPGADRHDGRRRGGVGPRETDRLVATHRQDLLAAEALANFFHRPELAGPAPDADPDRPPVSPADAVRIRRSLEDMQRRWRDLDPGAGLTVDWP
jgi:hypothetical protein